MRHVDNDLIFLGCLRRGSSDENQMDQKYFNCLYDGKKKHIDELGQQLLSSWIDLSFVLSHYSEINENI